MSKTSHEIEVVVLEGENGTVHVSTHEGLDDQYVEKTFDSIAARLGDTATFGAEIAEPALRTKTIDDRLGADSKGRSSYGTEKPTKLQK